MTDRLMPAPRRRARPITVTPGLERRFWAKVDRSGGPEACWLWTGKTQNGGYGVLVLDGERTTTVYAHRVSWAVHTGDDPGEHLVCHRCDTPGCVNHAHHFLGTPAENAADMKVKGRQRPGGAKLDAAAVRDIRMWAEEGVPVKVLAGWYEVARRTIRDVLRGRTWANVDTQREKPAAA